MKRLILLTLMVLGVMVATGFATNTTTQPLAATCVRQASSIIALQTTPQSPIPPGPLPGPNPPKPIPPQPPLPNPPRVSGVSAAIFVQPIPPRTAASIA